MNNPDDVDQSKPKPKPFTYPPARTYLIPVFAVIVLSFFALYKQNTKLEHQIQDIKFAQDTLSHQNQSLAKSVIETTKAFQFVKKTVEKKSSPNDQTQDYLLEKARYYLELAKINAHFAFHKETTISLLIAADETLAQSTHPNMINLRQAITDDIQRLKALSQTDPLSILMTLEAIKKNLFNLPFKTPLSETKTNPSPSSHPSSTWQKAWQDSLAQLEKLVVLRKHESTEDITLLNPLYKNILKETILMQLQVAIFAIIENQEPLYQSALNEAILDISRIFDVHDARTQQIIQELNRLKHLSLSQPQPTIGQALDMVNQLIQNKEGRP